jgi:hypothetical protein
MNFLKGLFGSFSGEPAALFYDLAVKCNRCGEIIHTQINLNNDLSVEYGDDGSQTYICRKVLMGKGRCFQQIEVSLVFDAQKKLLSSEMTGGVMTGKEDVN